MPRDLLPDLPNASSNNSAFKDAMSQMPNNNPSLLEQLTSFKPNFQNPLNFMAQDAQQTANSPGMHALQGAQDELQKVMSLGYFPKNNQAEGTAYNVGKGLGGIAGFLGGGELADLARLGIGATKAGSLPGIQYITKALEASPLAKRVAGSAAFGADVNPDNRLMGALLSGAGQLGMEGLGAGIKSIPKLAELFNPLEGAKQELGNIRNAYKASQAAQEEAYKPFNEIAKNYKLNNPNNFKESLVENSDYMTPNVKSLYKKFVKDPTLERAHKLQSQMISDIKKLSTSDPEAATLDKIQGLETLREDLNKDIINNLRRVDRNAATNYKEGARIHKDEIRPYLSNPNLANLVEGEIDEITPNEIASAIKKSKVKKQLPENHYLREALSNIQKQINKGNAAQYVIPPAIGAIGSQMIHPGLASLGVGLGAGGLAGLGGTKFAEFIQNPEIQKLLGRLKPVEQSAPLLRAVGNQFNN